MPIIESSIAATLLSGMIPVLCVIIGWGLNDITGRRSQRLAFEHRFRLEKEYELCVDLWSKLFELRRAVGQLTSPVSNSASVNYNDDQIMQRFNAFQAVVRTSEPFLCSTVYDPAREIVTLARNIIDDNGAEKAAEERRSRTSSDIGDQIAAKQMELYKNKQAAFTKIDELFQKVSKEIRHRVRPQ